MTEQKHTPEPWANGSFHKLLIVPIENGHPNKHAPIADLGETEFPYNANLDSEQRYANARRIVACVNACAGVSTEHLEDNLLVKELVLRHNEVIRQRDELLAAMVKAADEIRRCDYTPARSTLLTTIAIVKGSAD